MNSSNEIKLMLEHKAYKLRQDSLIMTTMAGSGHPTSCLSAADLVAALFFYAMRYDPQHFDNPTNDRFILSKGHAAPLLYAAWSQAGVMPESHLWTYRKIDSDLEGHPTARFAYAEAATGSLGIGLSIGVGMSLAARLDKRDYYTYVILGDAEIAEGSIWEASELASFYRLDNLVGIVDCNRLGQSTESLNGHHVERYAHKFEAFGWKTFTIDGHDMQQIMSALDKAREHKGSPIMIIAKTLKGHGVNLVENKEGFHGKPFTKEQLNDALEQLQATFPAAAAYEDGYQFQPHIPAGAGLVADTKVDNTQLPIPEHPYALGSMVATRKAYGVALSALGSVHKKVVSLDAEVKNSTFADIFEAQFPERFFQCFVAEQNMVSMGVGFDCRGHIPFISTFAAFFSRAFDQLRMAVIGNAHLRLAGSHCGVSIGQDGPSQMGLEDIALMRSLPGSCVLYPCDAVSTHKLVGLMAQYKGIAYLRTTRMETPVLYPEREDFVIGGCKLLRSSESDIACIVGAGVTVVEALKAYEILRKEGVYVAVIDLYSVKPLDGVTLALVGKKAGNRVITVEDHYLQGGLGEAVTYELRASGIALECLAVPAVPRSGKPEELLAWAGIDATALVKAVKRVA